MNSPTRPYRAVRAFVGGVLVLGFFAVWAYSVLTAGDVGDLYQMLAVALILAGAYAVLGEATVGAAVEDAQDLAGDGDPDDEGESA